MLLQQGHKLFVLVVFSLSHSKTNWSPFTSHYYALVCPFRGSLTCFVSVSHLFYAFLLIPDSQITTVFLSNSVSGTNPSAEQSLNCKIGTPHCDIVIPSGVFLFSLRQTRYTVSLQAQPSTCTCSKGIHKRGHTHHPRV